MTETEQGSNHAVTKAEAVLHWHGSRVAVMVKSYKNGMNVPKSDPIDT